MLYAVTLAVVAAYPLLTYPSQYFSPEVWAEAGSYFYNARWENLPRQLLLPDSGYFPLIARWFSLAVHWAGIPVAAVPYCYQWFALALQTFCFTFFLFPIFRTVVTSDVTRAGLVIGLAQYQSYDFQNYINLAYPGTVPLLLTLLFPAAVLSLPRRSLVALTLFLGAILLSKGVFVAFVPVFLLMALLHHRRAQRASRNLFLAIAGLGSLQAVYLLGLGVYSRTVAPDQAPAAVGLSLSTFWNALAFTLVSAAHAVAGRVLTAVQTGDWFAGAAAAALLVVLAVQWKREGLRPSRTLENLLPVTLLVFLSTLLPLLRFPSFLSLPFGSFPAQPYLGPAHYFDRWSYLQNVSWYLLAATTLARSFTAPAKGMAALAVLVLVSTPFHFHPPFKREPGWPVRGFGDWRGFQHQAGASETFVPLNPYPHHLAKGYGVVEEWPSIEETQTARPEEFTSELAVPAALGGRVAFVGVWPKGVEAAEVQLLRHGTDGWSSPLASLTSPGHAVVFFRIEAGTDKIQFVGTNGTHVGLLAHPTQPRPLWLWVAAPVGNSDLH